MARKKYPKRGTSPATPLTARKRKAPKRTRKQPSAEEMRAVLRREEQQCIDELRKERVRPLLRACEGAIGEFMDHMRVEYARTVATLREVHKWLDGEPMPASLAVFPEIARAAYYTVNQTPEERAAADGIDLYQSEIPLFEQAVLHVLSLATGTPSDGMAKAIDDLMSAIEKTTQLYRGSSSGPLETAVMTTFERALGKP